MIGTFSGLISTYASLKAAALQAGVAQSGAMPPPYNIIMIASTVAALASAMATVSSFAQGGIVGHAAGGMLIPGNSLSGDRLRMPVIDTGGYAGVNSGELILNKAQSNVIASVLDGQGQQTSALQPYVDGEKIFLGMNNTSKRMGRGEIVTTGMLRKLGLMG